MGLFDNIDKLINERGSANILRERLLLAEDKYSALENKYAALIEENLSFKDKAKTLESDFQKATKEIQRLNEVIKSINEKQGIKKLEQVTEQILKSFFDTGRELSVNDFSRFMSMNTSTIDYHFDLLIEKDFISQTTIGFESSWTEESSPAMFSITPAGRKYIIENNLS